MCDEIVAISELANITYIRQKETKGLAGLSTMGSISLGIALVAGSTLVPRPAAGVTASQGLLDTAGAAGVSRSGSGGCKFSSFS